MIKIIDKHKARLVVEVGNGSKRKRKTKVVTYTGKRDLQNQYADFEREATAPPLSGLTVDELLQSYIKNRKMLGLKPTTEHGYNSARKRINEVFDGVLAKELTTYMLDEFIMQMTEKYSPKTIANTIFPLNAAYERAIKTGQLTHNPCANVTLPKRAKKEIKTLSLDEMIKLMTALEDERLDYMVGYELCLLCGMRRSEVLALREDDLNLMFKFVTISKSRHIVDGKEYIQDTKTERSHRTLALPEKVVEDIARLIELHHSQVWNHCDYLIQDGFGHPMNPATFSDRITYIEDGIGISRVSVHGLRHTFATLLNSEGVDIAQISAELGHSNISTTLNIYTHVFGDVTASSRGIASAIDRKLNGTFTALDDKEKTIGA